MQKIMMVLICLLLGVRQHDLLTGENLKRKIQDPVNPILHDVAREVVAPHVVAFKHPYFEDIYGTGFRLQYKGKSYIITNRHVCAVSNQFNPKVARVNNEIHKIISISSKWDLCALEDEYHTDGLILSPVTPVPLDKVILAGHPMGRPLTIENGRVVGWTTTCVFYGKSFECRRAMNINVLSYPGNSGSPVTDSHGRVLGVLYAGNISYPHYPSIVPFESLIEFLGKLK